MTAVEARYFVSKAVIWVVVVLAAVLFGELFTMDLGLLIMLLGAVAIMATIPYHADIAIRVGVATYSSALLVPFVRGRPLVWEIAGLIGWSGLVVVLLLRRFDADAPKLIKRYKWLLIGAAGYGAVLLMIMKLRGVGFLLLGNSEIGGRVYIQQLIMLVFPLLFCLVRCSERLLYRLFVMQVIMASTFVISDLALAYRNLLWPVLYFFELSNDAMLFDWASSGGGIRRYQSLSLIAWTGLQALLVFVPLKDFTNRRGFLLIPLVLALLGVGAIGGHRMLLVFFTFLFLLAMYAQRFFSVVRVMAMMIFLAMVLAVTYLGALQMPLAAQRTLALLPGIEISPIAREDGEATWMGRRVMREAGWQIAPQYRWLGRGFGRTFGALDERDPVQAHISSGVFYNGFIGLLVNTGLPGTVFMLMFLGTGTWYALQIFQLNRRMREHDRFARLATVLAAVWFSNAFSFIFLHGDVEFAMRTFSLPSAMLLACHARLAERFARPAATETEAIAALPAPVPPPRVAIPVIL